MLSLSCYLQIIITVSNDQKHFLLTTVFKIPKAEVLSLA